MALKLDIKNLPAAARGALAVTPSVVLVVIAIIIFILPKQKEIKALDAKIDDQNNKIAASMAKASKLDILMKENEKLLKRLTELKEYLPEEKEISSLLKEISDRAIDSGLVMKSWKPGTKAVHSSGIVYEIPVNVVVSGTYHDFGRFLSSLTKLNRIVNINNVQIKAGSDKQDKRGSSALQISCTAATFSAIPADEIEKIKKTDKNKKI